MGLKSYFVPQKPTQDSNIEDAEVVPSNKTDEGPAPSSGANTQNNSTPWTSRPASFVTDEEMSDTRCEIMVSWLHQQQIEKTWFDGRASDEGVVLKKSKDEYACCPENLADEPNGFCTAVEMLNVRVSLHDVL